MSETNKAALQSSRQLSAIPEDAKIEILKKINEASNNALAPINGIKAAAEKCAIALKDNKSLTSKTNDRLSSILKSLNGLKEQVRALKTDLKNKKLENILKNSVSTIGTTKSAIAPQYDNLGKLVDTAKIIARQQKEQTIAAANNTQQIINGAEAQTKAVLLNQDKVTKANERKKALGNNEQKPKLNPEPKKKEKTQRPILPFSMKEFLGGLGGILSGILNPLAIIKGLIVQFLPYVILGVSFFIGVWSSLSTDLKKKAIEIKDKIVKYALIAFALFKGPVLLMKTFETIHHTARMFYLTAKWAKDMFLWAFQMKGEVKKQKAESGFLLFRKAKEMIRHTAEMLSIAFKNKLAFIQFLFSLSATVLIVGAILLLVVGVIYLMAKFSDQILKAVTAIIEVFRGIGSLIVDACIGFFKIVFSPVIALIEGIAKAIAFAFLGGRPKTEQEKVKEKQVTVKMDNSYVELINKVTGPLNSIKDAVVALRNFFVGSPMDASSRYQFPAMTAVPESTNISNIKSNNLVTIKSSDSINKNVNTNYVQSETSDYSKSIKQLVEGLEKLNTEFGKFVKKYRPPRGSGGGYADGQ